MATETETEIKDDDLPKIWKKEIPTLTEKHCFLIIHNWIRVSMLNVLLGDDVLVLLSRFANLKKTPYKSSFSSSFAGKFIEIFQQPNYSRASGYGVARMVDPLPHGTITEFTCDSISPLVGVMTEGSKCYEVIPEEGHISQVRFENDYPKLLGFYGMSCGYGEPWNSIGGNHNITNNQFGFLSCGKISRYDDFSPETHKAWVIGSGKDHKEGAFEPNQYSEPWTGIGGQVVVRVNLIDYLVSFWDKRSNNFIALKNAKYKSKAYRTWGRFSGGIHGYTDVDYLNCPVVIELPKNPNANWYPAVFLTQVDRSTGCTYSRNDTKSVQFSFETDT
eukprot:100944_1